jgi:hypothetical protein
VGLKFGPDSAQLIAMGGGKPFQNLFSFGGQDDFDLSAVFKGMLSRYEAFDRQPIDQPDSAVVTNLETLCQVADRDGLPVWKTFDGQKRLVLLGGESDFVSSLFAKSKEPPQRIAKRRKGLVLTVADLGARLAHFGKQWASFG